MKRLISMVLVLCMMLSLCSVVYAAESELILEINVPDSGVHSVSLIEQDDVYYIDIDDLAGLFGKTTRFDDENNCYVIPGGANFEGYVTLGEKGFLRIDRYANGKVDAVEFSDFLPPVKHNGKVYIDFLNGAKNLGGLLHKKGQGGIFMLPIQNSYNELIQAANNIMLAWGREDARGLWTDENASGYDKFADYDTLVADALADIISDGKGLDIVFGGIDVYLDDWQRAGMINTLVGDVGYNIDSFNRRWKDIKYLADMIDSFTWEPEINELMIALFGNGTNAISRFSEFCDMSVAGGLWNFTTDAVDYAMESLKLASLSQEKIDIANRIFVDNYNTTKNDKLRDLIIELNDQEYAQSKLLGETIVKNTTKSGIDFIEGAYAKHVINNSFTGAGGTLFGTLKSIELVVKITLKSIEIQAGYDFGTRVGIKEISDVQQVVKKSYNKYLSDFKYTKNTTFEEIFNRSQHIRDCAIMYFMLYETAANADADAINGRKDKFQAVLSINPADTAKTFPAAIDKLTTVGYQDVKNMINKSYYDYDGSDYIAWNMPNEENKEVFNVSMAQSIAASIKSMAKYDFAADIDTEEQNNNVDFSKAVWFFGDTIDMDGDGAFEVIGVFSPRNTNVEVPFVVSYSTGNIVFKTIDMSEGTYEFATNAKDGKTYLCEFSNDDDGAIVIYEFNGNEFAEKLIFEKGTEDDEISEFVNGLMTISPLPVGSGNVHEQFYVDARGDTNDLMLHYENYVSITDAFSHRVDGTLDNGKPATMFLLKDLSKSFNIIGPDKSLWPAWNQNNITAMVLAVPSENGKGVRFYSVDIGECDLMSNKIEDISLENGVLKVTTNLLAGKYDWYYQIVELKDNMYLYADGSASNIEKDDEPMPTDIQTYIDGLIAKGNGANRLRMFLLDSEETNENINLEDLMFIVEFKGNGNAILYTPESTYEGFWGTDWSGTGNIGLPIRYKIENEKLYILGINMDDIGFGLMEKGLGVYTNKGKLVLVP